MRVPRVKVSSGLYPLCMKTIEVFQAAMWGVQVAQDPTSVPTSAVDGKSTACVQLFSVMAESASSLGTYPQVSGVLPFQETRMFRPEGFEVRTVSRKIHNGKEIETNIL